MLGNPQSWRTVVMTPNAPPQPPEINRKNRVAGSLNDSLVAKLEFAQQAGLRELTLGKHADQIAFV